MKRMVMQKIAGLIMVALGVLSATETGDSTAAVIIVPMGLYVTFTKDKVMTFDGDVKPVHKK